MRRLALAASPMRGQGGLASQTTELCGFPLLSSPFLGLSLAAAAGWRVLQARGALFCQATHLAPALSSYHVANALRMLPSLDPVTAVTSC